MFINNCPTTGITINSFRKARGYANSDVVGLVDDILNGRPGCCPLEAAKDALEDGSLWDDDDHTKEATSLIHTLICQHEEISSLTHDDLMSE